MVKQTQQYQIKKTLAVLQPRQMEGGKSVYVFDKNYTRIEKSRPNALGKRIEKSNFCLTRYRFRTQMC
jgi:hypothetical protein